MVRCDLRKTAKVLSRRLRAIETGERSIVHLDFRTNMCEFVVMDGAEFERKIKRLARKRNVSSSFDAGRGKGSHGRLYYNGRFTTLKDRRKEIGPGLLAAMLDQFGLSRKDLED